LFYVFWILPGCQAEKAVPAEEGKMELSVFSPVFEEGSKIPARYTCDGEDVSPHLAWEGVPEGTETLALIVDDPDAPFGTWTHWVMFNLPSDTSELPEAVPAEAELPGGALQGRNDFGSLGYGGPCPPGPGHHYRFIVYALDQILELTSGASKQQLLDAMQGHILAQGQLTGIYR